MSVLLDQESNVRALHLNTPRTDYKTIVQPTINADLLTYARIGGYICCGEYIWHKRTISALRASHQSDSNSAGITDSTRFSDDMVCRLDVGSCGSVCVIVTYRCRDLEEPLQSGE